MVFGVFLFIVTVPCVAFSSQSRFANFAVGRTRALSMGGAYFSIRDELFSGLYNPAALEATALPMKWSVHFYLNPIAPVISAYDFKVYDRHFIGRNGLTTKEALLSLGVLLKGVTLSTPILDIGLIFMEEDIGDQVSHRRFFSARNALTRYNNSLIINLKLAPTVSMGIAGNLHFSDEAGKRNFDEGYAFGILLEPTEKLNVGITYNDIPDNKWETRERLNRVGDGTVTSGVSYYPDPSTILTVDLRNLNEEDKLALREIHAGFERTFFGRLALRGGIFRKRPESANVISLGMGLLPSGSERQPNNGTTRNDILSYTVVRERVGGGDVFWHFMSFIIRI